MQMKYHQPLQTQPFKDIFLLELHFFFTKKHKLMRYITSFKTNLVSISCWSKNDRTTGVGSIESWNTVNSFVTVFAFLSFCPMMYDWSFSMTSWDGGVPSAKQSCETASMKKLLHRLLKLIYLERVSLQNILDRYFWFYFIL